LVVTDQNNCSTTGSVIGVTDVDEQLDAPMYDEIVVLKGQSATLANSNRQPGSYDLYPSYPTSRGSSAVQTNATGDFATGTLDADTTLYIVLRKGDCSSAVVAVTIKVLPTRELIVPNAFSPNGDGHNDFFRIKNPQLVRTFAMTIFDRWGEKVFETTDPYKGWDGSYASHPRQTGTYVWTINYTDILGRNQSVRGTLVLVL
jgi:gliding motility-associated-like protein